MKKTIKTSEAVQAYNLVKDLKLAKVERKDVFVTIRNTGVLKPVATGYEDFVKDAQERLKPKGWDKLAEKMRAKEELTATESKAVEKYNKDLTDCINGELEKAVEIEVEAIDEDGFFALIQANESLSVEAFLLIRAVMCE